MTSLPHIVISPEGMQGVIIDLGGFPESMESNITVKTMQNNADSLRRQTSLTSGGEKDQKKPGKSPIMRRLSKSFDNLQGLLRTKDEESDEKKKERLNRRRSKHRNASITESDHALSVLTVAKDFRWGSSEDLMKPKVMVEFKSDDVFDTDRATVRGRKLKQKQTINLRCNGNELAKDNVPSSNVCKNETESTQLHVNVRDGKTQHKHTCDKLGVKRSEMAADISPNSKGSSKVRNLIRQLTGKSIEEDSTPPKTDGKQDNAPNGEDKDEEVNVQVNAPRSPSPFEQIHIPVEETSEKNGCDLRNGSGNGNDQDTETNIQTSAKTNTEKENESEALAPESEDSEQNPHAYQMEYENIILNNDSSDKKDKLDISKKAKLGMKRLSTGMINFVNQKSSESAQSESLTLEDEGDGDLTDSSEDWFDWSDFDESETEIDGNEDDIIEGEYPNLPGLIRELLTTEEVYVDKLNLLMQAKQTTVQVLGYGVAREIFPNLDGIHKLHADNLLPEMRERAAEWESKPRIGDIMSKCSPFLKMYLEYVKNFPNAIKKLDESMKKSSEFAKKIHEFEKSSKKSKRPDRMGRSESARLMLRTHMLEPIQRVPRYELLLKQYTKKLDDDNEDKQTIEKALTIITEAVHHYEDGIAYNSRMSKLMAIQKKIDGPINILGSNRELVRQGRVNKVNARTGKVVQRYAFLFTDLFLVCSELPISLYGTARYQLKQSLDMEGMQIREGHNLEVPNTFVIKTKTKALELCLEDMDEKLEWQKVLWDTVGQYTRSKLEKNNIAAKKLSSSQSNLVNIPESKLGKEAPVWVHNSDVSMCMICATDFSAFRRKHHCRACGYVVCHKCATHNHQMEYDGYKAHRVCDECFLKLTENRPDQQGVHPKINNNTLCVDKGYFEMSSDEGKTWKKRWLLLHEGGILYCYKAHQDILPISSMSLKGFKSTMCDIRDSRAVILEGEHKTYFFKDHRMEAMVRWIDSLNRATSDA